MYIVQRTLTFVRGFLLSYGPRSLKKAVWDKEFSGGKWDFIDKTASDCVYTHLETYARGGDILDLGCGPGNTANELVETAYNTYTGIDISESALEKARARTEENGRSHKNSFAQSDFLGYQPERRFDVILFRESLYHVPYGQVLPLLEKYAYALKPEGVFMVRLYRTDLSGNGKVKPRIERKLNLIRKNFAMVEERQYTDPGTSTVLVFRPRR